MVQENKTGSVARTAQDVIIIGAGFVGLALALALTRSNLRVTIIDRTKVPDPKQFGPASGMTTAVNASSRQWLAGLGVEPPAQTIQSIIVDDVMAGQSISFDSDELGAKPLGYIVDNHDLRRAMLQACSSQLCQWISPASLKDASEDDQGVTVDLEDGRSLRARVWIGADSARSQCRRMADIGAIESDYCQSSLVFSFTHAWPHAGQAYECFFPGGPLAVLPMLADEKGRPRSAVVWTLANDVADSIHQLSEQEFRALFTDTWGNRLGRITSLGQRWLRRLSFSHAHRYVQGRLVLVGDAAHALHPIAGQGLNLGWRDADCLADCLINAKRQGRDIGGLEVLAAYQRARRFDVTVMSAMTDLTNRVFSSRLLPSRLFRLAAMKVVGHHAFLRQAAAGYAMGEGFPATKSSRSSLAL